ncbi:hypothetical protein GJ496_011713, partial [Pomphorhynchus laevis]
LCEADRFTLKFSNTDVHKSINALTSIVCKASSIFTESANGLVPSETLIHINKHDINIDMIEIWQWLLNIHQAYWPMIFYYKNILFSLNAVSKVGFLLFSNAKPKNTVPRSSDTNYMHARKEILNFLADFSTITLVKNKVFVKKIPENNLSSAVLLICPVSQSSDEYFFNLRLFSNIDIHSAEGVSIVNCLVNRLLAFQSSSKFTSSNFSSKYRHSEDGLQRQNEGFYLKLISRPLDQLIISYNYIMEQGLSHDVLADYNKSKLLITPPLTTFYYHRTVIRPFINLDGCRISKKIAQSILDVIAQSKIRKGFQIARIHSSGVKTLTYEIETQPGNKNSRKCLVQYILFPAKASKKLVFHRRNSKSHSYELYFGIDYWIEPYDCVTGINIEDYFNQLEAEDSATFGVLSTLAYIQSAEGLSINALLDECQHFFVPSLLHDFFVCNSFKFDLNFLLNQCLQCLILFNPLSGREANKMLFQLFHSNLDKLTDGIQLPSKLITNQWLSAALQRITPTRSLHIGTIFDEWKCYVLDRTSNGDGFTVLISPSNFTDNLKVYPVFLYRVIWSNISKRIIDDALKPCQNCMLIDKTNAAESKDVRRQRHNTSSYVSSSRDRSRLSYHSGQLSREECSEILYRESIRYSTIFDRTVTKVVFNCILNNISVSTQDVETALSCCTRNSKEVPYTDYLRLACGHFREASSIRESSISSHVCQCTRPRTTSIRSFHNRFVKLISLYAMPVSVKPGLCIYSAKTSDFLQNDDSVETSSHFSSNRSSLTWEDLRSDILMEHALFLSFSVKVVCGSLDRTVPIDLFESIPLCLASLSKCVEDVLVPQDTSVYLIVECCMLPNYVFSRSSLSSYGSSNCRGQKGISPLNDVVMDIDYVVVDESKDPSDECRLRKITETMRYGSLDSKDGRFKEDTPNDHIKMILTSFMVKLTKEIRWIFENELASAMLVFPFSKAQLYFVVDHITSSNLVDCTLNKNCCLHIHALKFVLGSYASCDMFRKELSSLIFNDPETGQSFRFRRISVELFVLCCFDEGCSLTHAGRNRQSIDGTDLNTLASSRNQSNIRRWHSDVHVEYFKRCKRPSLSEQDIPVSYKPVIRSFSLDYIDDLNTDYDDEDEIWISPKVLPGFWLLFRMQSSYVMAMNEELNEYVEILLHVDCLSESKTPFDLFFKTSVHVDRLCTKVNQIMLLKELEDTRMCHAFLVPEDDDHPLNECNTSNEAITKPDTFVIPGQFACDVQWVSLFPLHVRLRPSSFRHCSAGMSAIHKAFHSHVVFNRRNMFVYRANNEESIYYILLTEVTQENQQSENDGQNSDVACDQPLQLKDSSSSPVVPSYRAVSKSSCIALYMHGLTVPDLSITDQIRSLILKRLDDEILNELVNSLLRNARCRLHRDDINFVKGGNIGSTVRYYELPQCPLAVKFYPVEYMCYLRQILQTIFINPTMPDDMYGERNINTLYFAHVVPDRSGVRQRGIAWIEINISDTLECYPDLISTPKANQLQMLLNTEPSDFSMWTCPNKMGLTDSHDSLHVLTVSIWLRGDFDKGQLLDIIEPCLEHASCLFIMEYGILSDPFPAIEHSNNFYCANAPAVMLRRSSSGTATVLQYPTHDGPRAFKQLSSTSEMSLSRRRATTDIVFMIEESRSFDNLDLGKIPMKKIDFLLHWLHFVAIQKSCVCFHYDQCAVEYNFSTRYVMMQLLGWLSQELRVQLFLFGRQSTKEDYVLLTDLDQRDCHSAAEYLVIVRDLSLWKQIFQSDEKSSPGSTFGSSSCIANYMRFDSFQYDSKQRSQCLPRQAIIFLHASKNNIQLYCYNWTNEMIDKLCQRLRTIEDFHRKRNALLNSVILQTLGLFQHNTFFNCQYHEEFSVNSLISNTLPTENGLNESHIIANEKHLIDKIYDTPVKQYIYQSSDESLNENDPVHRYCDRALIYHICRKKELSIEQKLSELYSNWLIDQNPTITKEYLHVLREHGRCIHALSTPLLFTDQAREKIKSQLDLKFEISSQSVPTCSRSEMDGKRNRLLRRKVKSSLIRLDESGSDVSSRQDIWEDVPWDRNISKLFINDYETYLRHFGFNSVRLIGSDSPTTSTFTYCTNLITERTFSDIGIFLIELRPEADGQFFVLKVIMIEQKKREQSKVLFSEQVINDASDKARDITHFNSFTYDFHLRFVHDKLKTLTRQIKDFPVVKFLNDFISYYSDRPVFARNVIYRDDIRREINIDTAKLWGYILEHSANYEVVIFSQTFPNSSPFIVKHQTPNGEYTSCAVVSLSPHSCMNGEISLEIFVLLMQKTEFITESIIQEEPEKKPTEFWKNQYLTVKSNVTKVSGVRGILAPYSSYLVGAQDEEVIIRLGKYLRNEIGYYRQIFGDMIQHADQSCMRDILWERLFRSDNRQKNSSQAKRTDSNQHIQIFASVLEYFKILKTSVMLILSRIPQVDNLGDNHVRFLELFSAYRR